MALRPLHDRVLVRRIEAEEKTAGGIIIPDSAKEKPSEGEIVAVGTGTKAEDGTVTPLDVKAGDRVQSGIESPIATGNCLPLRNIPVGTVVHCIELKPGKGAQMARSAGTSAQLVAREGVYATLRLRSGEMRRVPLRCIATVGQVSNLDHENQSLGKAGRARHMGLRPEVRGVAMTPRDHPHGGGEGKSPTGMPPKTPWGKPAMGYRTRRAKTTGRLIVRSRHRK